MAGWTRGWRSGGRGYGYTPEIDREAPVASTCGGWLVLANAYLDGGDENSMGAY